MRKEFLVGNFLPAYSTAYRYKDSENATESDLSLTTLGKRFSERSETYERRKRDYVLRVQLSTIGALLFTMTLFNLPFSTGGDFELAMSIQELVQMEEITPTQQKTLPPPPPKPPIPVEVPDETLLEDDDLDLDAVLDIDEPLADLPPPPPAPIQDDIAEPDFFVAVEVMPELIGGLQQLSKDLKYPALARKAGIEGTVVVQVIVDADGSPREASVVKSVADVLDKAAIEAVLKQSFKPGRQRNRAVSVRVAIPVRFRLT